VLGSWRSDGKVSGCAGEPACARTFPNRRLSHPSRWGVRSSVEDVMITYATRKSKIECTFFFFVVVVVSPEVEPNGDRSLSIGRQQD
jgi:hypothetical protein